MTTVRLRHDNDVQVGLSEEQNRKRKERERVRKERTSFVKSERTNEG